MAIQLRTTLKGYFQTGNIPVEQHYVDIIDSTLSISESNSGNIDLTGNISMSGNISSSGITGTHTLGGDVFITGILSSSGEISSSGAFTGSGINILGDITASGNIKCGDLQLGGELSAVNSDFTFMSGSKLTLDGAIVSSTLNTGQGAFELGQDVKTTSAVTFATVNTGQGANELYDMDQNVKTTSVVTFAGITLAKSNSSNGSYGGTINSEGQNFVLTLESCPVIPGKASGKIAKLIPTKITNSSVQVSSVVLATVSSAALSVNASKLTNGSFEINLSNEADEDFGGGTVVINFIIF